jgi:tRNA-dihydrouridine synthase
MLRETGCAAVMFARGAMGNPFIFSTTRSYLTTGVYEPPGAAQRIAMGFRHLERLAADIGERAACLEMRKHFCAYTRGRGSSSNGEARPGMAGGARLRNRLVHAASIEEYRLMLHDVIEEP